MIPFSLPNAAASLISVTTTATSLQSLIRTAGTSATYEIPQDADAIDIRAEAGNIRVLFDDVDPTAANGFYIPTNTYKHFRGPKLSKMRLISASGVPVSCSIIIGRSVPGLVTT